VGEVCDTDTDTDDVTVWKGPRYMLVFPGIGVVACRRYVQRQGGLDDITLRVGR